MLTDQIRCNALHSVIQRELILQALLLRKLLRIFLQDYRSRVRLTVNRMSHTIDQTRMVEALLIQESLQIFGDFILILPILHMHLHIIKHLLYLDIRTTMLRSLQRTKGSGNSRIRISSCRGQYVCRKC